MDAWLGISISMSVHVKTEERSEEVNLPATVYCLGFSHRQLSFTLLSIPESGKGPSVGRTKGIKHKHEPWTEEYQIHLDPISDSTALVSSKLRDAVVGRLASAKPMTGM